VELAWLIITSEGKGGSSSPLNKKRWMMNMNCSPLSKQKVKEENYGNKELYE
jgi:hypothetical protein